MFNLISNDQKLSCSSCGKVHMFITKGCVPVEVPDQYLDSFIFFGEVYKLSGDYATVTSAWRDYVQASRKPEESDQHSLVSVGDLDEPLLRA